MSLLSQFFPSTSNSNASGNFGSALNTDLSTFPVDILLVGGGGGGGIVPTTQNAACPGLTDPNAAIGGGGGGGRLIQYLNAVISTGTPYPITVGAGGAAGAAGGATCFGTTLIAGGGGGAGTPGTFGRGQYERSLATETSGSYGGDTLYVCPQLMRVASPNPSYPYFATYDTGFGFGPGSTCSLTASGRKFSQCRYYGDTTFASTYYDFVAPCTYHSVITTVGRDPGCDTWPVDCNSFCWNSYTCTSGSSICNPYYYKDGANLGSDAGFALCWYGGDPASPSDTCMGSYINAIFKKINHPQANYSRFGISGQGGNAVSLVPYTAPSNSKLFGGSCGYVNTQVGAVAGLCCFYIEGTKCGCFPNIPFGSQPQYRIGHPLGYAQMYLSPAGGCPTCGTFTNANDRSANGARAQFAPVANVCVRTALLSTNCFSLMDHGPGLYNAPQNAYYLQDYGPNFGVPICSTNAYPSVYEAGYNPQGCACGANASYFAVQCGRFGVSPFGYNVICSTSTSRLRMFNPNTDSVGLVTGTNSGTPCAPFLSGPLLPFVSAPVAPIVEGATWASAENGVAGWGAGGGGGVNSGGIGTVTAFKYQYNPGVIPSNGVAPTNCIDLGCGRYDTYTFYNNAIPVVCYSRCIGPSPAAVATGGSGGSGAIYVVYPTNYPAATVTGNTPVPSPPAYRVYYWTGNGSITFN